MIHVTNRGLLFPAALLVSAICVSPAVAQKKQKRPEPKRGQEQEKKPAQPKPLAATKLIRKRLGIRFSIMGSKIRRSNISTDTAYGFSVRSVAKESLAAKLGLKRDDVILEIDGKPFREEHELATVLRKAKPGGTIKLTASRRKKKLRVLDRKPWKAFAVALRLPGEKAAAKPAAKRRAKQGEGNAKAEAKAENRLL